MEHLHHFGLASDPFRNEPQLLAFLETRPHVLALRRLDRAVRQSKGLCVLTGENGAGKTMVVRRLHESLEEEVFDVSMLVVLTGAADTGWMLKRFAAQLGIEQPAPERDALLAQLYEQLAIVREDGRHAVFIIDDAEVLTPGPALSEVCGLLKLEYEGRRLLTLVLAGGPQLDAALANDPLLAHGLDVRVRLGALDEETAAAYLAERIRAANGKPAILEPDARDALLRLGRRLPGRMNTLADNALFEAFLAGRPAASAADVVRAHLDLGWDLETPSPERVDAAPPAVAIAAPAPVAQGTSGAQEPLPVAASMATAAADPTPSPPFAPACAAAPEASDAAGLDRDAPQVANATNPAPLPPLPPRVEEHAERLGDTGSADSADSADSDDLLGDSLRDLDTELEAVFDQRDPTRPAGPAFPAAEESPLFDDDAGDPEFEDPRRARGSAPSEGPPKDDDHGGEEIESLLVELLDD